MNAPLAAQRAGTAQIVSLPGPLGGWNTRDAINAMDAADAIELTNLFPGVAGVAVRGGYETHVASGIGSATVETLAALTVGATEHFLCGTNGKIWNITNGASPVDITGAATITEDRWRWTTFAPSASPTAPVVIFTNGTDTPLTWGGAGNVAAWAPTGPTAAAILGVASFKNRLYCWELNSRDFWYGEIGALTGTFTRFPLSGIRGAQGNLIAMATWTRDGGAGPDDFAAFITDQGSVIVYAGYWPGGGEATWSLVGVYTIPRPLGPDAWAPLLGDIVIATDADYISMSEAIQAGGVTTAASKLSGAIQADSASYRANAGWQMIAYPRGDKLLCNIPIAVGTRYNQHVWNMQTRAGCLFTGWNMNVLGTWRGNLYGGGLGKVYRLDVGLSDDAGGTPTRIPVRARCAYTDLGAPGIKRVSAVRPLLRVSDTLRANYALGVDYADQALVPLNSTGTSGTSSAWDDPLWDAAYWSLESQARLDMRWRMLGGRGVTFAAGLSVDILDQRLTWISTEYLVERAARI
jgi:hypothetical protein